MVIKFENWKGKRVIVIRGNNGKIISWRRAKYKDTKEKVRKEISDRGTFIKNVSRSVKTFSNKTREITVLTKSEFIVKDGIIKSSIRKNNNLRIDDTRSVQYVFKGKLNNGQEIFARSSTFQDFSKSGKEKARNEAFENFVYRLSNPNGEGGYDADEGLEILEKNVSFVEEGFVFYDRKEKIYNR